MAILLNLVKSIVKTFKILKIPDLLRLQELKLYYKHTNNKLPAYYLQQMSFVPNRDIHGHMILADDPVQHEFAKRCIRFNTGPTFNDQQYSGVYQRQGNNA